MKLTVTAYTKQLQKYRILVIFFWILLVITLGGLYAPQLTDRLSSDFSPVEGTDSYNGQQLLNEYFPQIEEEFAHIIVVNNPENSVLIQELHDFTLHVLNHIQTEYSEILSDTGGYYLFEGTEFDFAKSEFVSTDNHTSIILFEFNTKLIGQRPIVDFIRTAIDSFGPTTFDAYLTGMPALDVDGEHELEGELAFIDSIVIPVVLLALAILLKRWKYTLISLPSILMSIILAFALLERYIYVTEQVVETFIPSVLISLTLGIGVDYNLFLLSRYQEEQEKENSVESSVETMLHYAGHTVFTSGMTLVLSLLALIFFPLAIFSSIGVGIAISVVVLLLIHLSFTPALLFVLGSWINPQKDMDGQESTSSTNKSTDSGYNSSLWYKIGQFTTRHGLVIMLAVLIITVPIALQMAETNPNAELLGLSPRGTESADGLEILSEDFNPGYIAPGSLIIAPLDGEVWSNQTFLAIQDFIEQAISRTALDAHDFTSPAWLNGERIPLVTALSLTSISSPYFNTTEGQLYRYISSEMISGNMDGYQAVLVEFIFPGDPLNYEATEITQELNRIAEEIYPKDIFDYGFIGINQSLTDAQDKSFEYFPYVIIALMIVIYLFLSVMFKAYLLPLRLIFTSALTLSFIYGAATVVFQYDTFLNGIFPILNDMDYLYWMLPVMSFSVIIGLGLDYDIFTLERIREKTFDEGLENKEAISQALKHTGSIITGAGLMMMLAFGGMMFSSSIILIQFGFILCFAVFLDTFLVRTILLPAIMGFAEKWNWWPSKVA